MKKKLSQILSSPWLFIFSWVAINLAIYLVIIPIYVIKSNGAFSLFAYFKISTMFLGAVILILVILTNIVALIFLLYNMLQEINKKTSIIKIFSLKKNSSVEIYVDFYDCEKSRKFFIEVLEIMVKDFSLTNSSFSISTIIKERNLKTPISVNNLSTKTLIGILETYGCKFYLTLNDEGKFYWSIKSPSGRHLYKQEISNYQVILRNFTPKK